MVTPRPVAALAGVETGAIRPVGLAARAAAVAAQTAAPGRRPARATHRPRHRPRATAAALVSAAVAVAIRAVVAAVALAALVLLLCRLTWLVRVARVSRTTSPGSLCCMALAGVAAARPRATVVPGALEGEVSVAVGLAMLQQPARMVLVLVEGAQVTVALSALRRLGALAL
jgi:hypothetical protein